MLFKKQIMFAEECGKRKFTKKTTGAPKKLKNGTSSI
jgi:hypothetical protein